MPYDNSFFAVESPHNQLAQALYEQVRDVPIVSPHGHVDPRLFAEDSYDWGSPVDMFILPDHYIFRLLYSQGIALEDLGIPRLDGAPVETDHRKIWQLFADNFYLFRGTPTGIWLRDELARVFGITDKLTSKNAQAIYDTIASKLQHPDYTPRKLYEQFNIEVLCTTDFATDTLEHHRAIRDSGWQGDIRPTFRPDDVVQVHRPDWHKNINKLSDLTGIDIVDYQTFIHAVEIRRDQFRELGAVATDHDVPNAQTLHLKPADAASIFNRALSNTLEDGDTIYLQNHLILELARMSVEDGMVMQLHVGSYRNHNQHLYNTFGRDMGADIPHTSPNFVYGLRDILNTHGNNPNFRLIVFTLDESTYSRELAPLAGHYPAMFLGPPWWFHDSLNGMRRYFDRVMETASIYNTAGFNDDTRAFPSIPARHDIWRTASADWLAGLVLRGIIDENDATEMVHDLAYGLAKRAYKL
ncbi:MAG: glucuronate isomerase [Chloroflexota bacterium]